MKVCGRAFIPERIVLRVAGTPASTPDDALVLLVGRVWRSRADHPCGGELERFEAILSEIQVVWPMIELTPAQARTLHTISRAIGFDWRTGDPVDPLVDEPLHLESLPALVEAGLVELPRPGRGTPLWAQLDATPVRLTAAGRCWLEAQAPCDDRLVSL